MKSNLCEYNDAYILVKFNITIAGNIAARVPFKNCAPFTKSLTKIDGTTMDDAEDLELVMPIYCLKEYSSNYSDATGSLWFYSKDEATIFNANIADTNNSKSFKRKTKLIGSADEILENATISLPLKYLRNVWRSLDMSLIN